MSRHDRRLHRGTDDRKIGGVCSGLARYFDLDPLLVRVAFVAATAVGGAAIVAYVLLWWLVDPAPAGSWDGEPGCSGPGRHETDGPLAPTAAVGPDQRAGVGS